MALFQKKMGPVFLKEDSDAAAFIAKMQELEQRVDDPKVKAEIQKKIKLASYGEAGEKNISFELKNSGMDMYILHDIYLEYGEMSAQIDYLVITRKIVYVIECKNLIGNIEIDSQGNFIRTYELFGKKVKEGIYSPITQNKRHLEVIKNVRKESKSNLLYKVAFEHFFDNSYKSIVVLANPKTYLNAKFAKKEVKDQVIRADQIINKIREMNALSKEPEWSEKEMLEVAQFFLEMNKSERSDYSKSFEELAQQIEEQEEKKAPESKGPIKKTNVKAEEDSRTEALEQTGESPEKVCPKCGKPMILRVASKGQNAGNKFYGCSGFPGCRYIENC